MKKIALYSFIFTLFSAFLFNNGNKIKDLVRSKLNTYSANAPEKIYIHTDKPYYTLDEDLWFCIYLVHGISHEKSTKSAVVYVELFNEVDSLLKRKRLYIENISAGGHFKIEKNWSPGNYLLRAYTNYMRNENPRVFFQKEIQIISLDIDNSKHINKNTTSTAVNSGKNVKPELHFFPESGYLVENINSKIAVKIKNPQYHNSKIPVEIVDSNGTVLTKFNTIEFGLGLFYIKPQANQNYFANITLDGKFYQYQLPKALPNGYGLSINNRETELLIALTTNKIEGLNASYLIAHQRGNILFDKVLTTQNKTDIINLSTRNLKDGVLHITLFNTNDQPVCERLVYINNTQNKINTIIQKDKNEYATREKVTLELQLKDKAKNIEGHISLSIRDTDAIPYNADASNIKTWLLLNSDLRGKISNPGYFFSQGESLKKAYLLDLVMMTNGWRRFTWQSILNVNQKPNKFKAEKGITISGTTKTLETPNSPVAALNNLTFIGNQSLVLERTNSDKDGKFSFGPFIFYDSIPTLIESKLTTKNSKNYRNVSITINNSNYNIPKIERFKPDSNYHQIQAISTNYIETANYIRNINLDYDEERQRLDEVVITAKKKTKEEEREVEMNKRSFYGSPTRRLDMESDGFLSKTPMKFIFQRFAGVKVGDRSLYYRGEPCRILFNNMEVDLEFISALDPTNITFIDFYSGADAAVYGRTTGGVFTVYGKLGADTKTANASRRKGIINFYTKGFDCFKTFYAPDYSKNFDQITRTDIRTTLHWEPKVKLTAKQPSKRISFYTSDVKRTYLIEIEGITDTGIPIYETSYFSVN